MDLGCSGGQLFTSWTFLKFFGTVSEQCKPYHSGDGTSGHCKIWGDHCDDEKVEYKKYKANNFYSMSGAQEAMEEIFKNGPIETGFTVYEDFISYKSGVYRHTTGGFLGGHAVKIVGFGEENNEKYWIVANSWGEDWGEKGFFRILQGDSGIDDSTYSGLPYLQ